MTRLAALGERLDAPLLVTNLTNVLYLTRLRQLECRAARRAGWRDDAVHRLPLHAEAAQAVAGVDGRADEALADASTSASKLQRHGAVRGRRAPVPQWERLTRGQGELVPTRGIVDVRTRGQGRRGGREAAPGRADRRSRARGADRGDLGRPERARARLAAARAAARARRATSSRSPSIVASGPNGAKPHAHPTDDDRRDGHARDGRLGRAGRRLLHRLHAHVLDRRVAARRAPPGVRRLSRGAADAPSPGSRRG